jgi:mRNA interferase MazF
MQKDFDTWNNQKKLVNDFDSSSIYFKEREIWWCHFGANVGQEQDGKGGRFMRPVLIFKKFARNLCWVIPLSTKARSGSFFFPLLAESNTIRIATLPQMKLIDTKRLIEKLDSISVMEHGFVKEKITAFIR